MLTSTAPDRVPRANRAPARKRGNVLVACPDARPPAYEAVAGLASQELLQAFATSFYQGTTGSRCLPGRLRGRLERRRHELIPADLVAAHPEVDLALAAENRMPLRAGRRAIARARTEYFDRRLRARVARARPAALLAFSDVASRLTLPFCQQNGIPSVVSVVHGDPAEERALLEREAERSPEYFSLYLGDGRLDRAELGWLHDRRAHDRERAALLLVPSHHIAERMIEHGVEPSRLRVVPYAADTRRFQPREPNPSQSGCTFVFAGGITQRKGIGYLLAAWRKVRRAGWTLRLVGALPSRLGPLSRDLDQPGIELAGRVGHGDMPAELRKGDVFVFPSLFEGSAVVTYEALAAGLPSIVTRESGSVARDGIEGLVADAGDPDGLAQHMERLGSDGELRRAMGQAARKRGEEFDWPRYRAAVVAAIQSVVG